jgi:hypothetical protein
LRHDATNICRDSADYDQSKSCLALKNAARASDWTLWFLRLELADKIEVALKFPLLPQLLSLNPGHPLNFLFDKHQHLLELFYLFEVLLRKLFFLLSLVNQTHELALEA